MMGCPPPCSSSKSSLSICRLLLFGILVLLLATSLKSFYYSSAIPTVCILGVLSTSWFLAFSRDPRRIPSNSFPSKANPLPSLEAELLMNKADPHGTLRQRAWHCRQQTDSDDCCDPFFHEDADRVPLILSESSATDEDPAESTCSDDTSVSHESSAGELVTESTVPAGAYDDKDDDIDSRPCSDGSISDDDSLIEIALADGHPLAPWEETAGEMEGELMYHQPPPRGPTPPQVLPAASTCRGLIRGPEPFSLPELQFLRRHGLIELLTEIGEEENLIEIDINMGSIKCPGLAGIRA